MKKERQRTLTPMQSKFVSEYLKTGNATQAAIGAGYKGKDVNSYAYRILRSKSVAKELERRQNFIDKELRKFFIYDAIQARQVMLDILAKDEAFDKDRIRVAIDFLDRAGFKATEKIEQTVKEIKIGLPNDLIDESGEKDDKAKEFDDYYLDDVEEEEGDNR